MYATPTREYRGTLLFGLLLINAISSMGGGLALMTGWIPNQPSWVQHTDFPSLYFPGVVLMAIVGGSSLVAAVAMRKGVTGWQLTSVLSGVIMLFWIIGEIASIRGFHVLQVVYFVTGGMVIWLTPALVRSAGLPAPTSPEAVEGSGDEVGHETDAVEKAVGENRGPHGVVSVAKHAEENRV
jgi:hypothetical protein